MRLFWEILKLSWQRQWTYRASNWAGLVTNLFFGLLRAALITALYAHRPSVEGVSLNGAITYTGLTQAIIAFLYIFGSFEIMNSVYSGEVATDLLKPLNFYAFWLARDLGRALVGFALRGTMIMGAYALLFQITMPTRFWQWIAFFVALFLGWLVSFSWRFLVNISAFWIPNATGIGRMAFALSWFLSGFMMPLRFFPEPFVMLCSLTPFPSMVNTIIEVYLGVLSGPEILVQLGIQLAWFIGLFGAGQVALRAGVRRLVILGG